MWTWGRRRSGRGEKQKVINTRHAIEIPVTYGLPLLGTQNGSSHARFYALGNDPCSHDGETVAASSKLLMDWGGHEGSEPGSYINTRVLKVWISQYSLGTALVCEVWRCEVYCIGKWSRGGVGR